MLAMDLIRMDDPFSKNFSEHPHITTYGVRILTGLAALAVIRSEHFRNDYKSDRDVVVRIISCILCLLVICMGLQLGYNGSSLELVLYKTTELLYFTLNAGVCYLCHTISQENTRNLSIIITISTIMFLMATYLLNTIKLSYVVSALMSFYTLYLYRRVSKLLYMDAQTQEIRGRLQGLIWIEGMLASLSVFIFLADTILSLNVWLFKASLIALMHLKITLFIVSLPKGGPELKEAGVKQDDWLRYLENNA